MADFAPSTKRGVGKGAWLAATAIALTACGGGQTRGAIFDSAPPAEDAKTLAAFARQIAETPVFRGVDVAVGTVDGAMIVGARLTGGATWRYAHPLDGRPTVVGSVVVGIGGGELFALDAKTGRLLWSKSASGRLRGAGDDGALTVVSLQSMTGHGSTVLAVTHDGAVVRQVEDDVAIGVPAVAFGVALLPWGGRNVSLYDIVRGEETARVVLPMETSRVFARGGAIFMGEADVTRFDEAIGGHPAVTTRMPPRPLPGSPRWMPSGLEVLARQANHSDSVRLYARPAARGPAGVEGDHVAATYFAIAMGLDATSGATRWVHGHDADFIGGAAYASGFALCDRAGKVTFLDGATGQVAGGVSLGSAVDACVVQADGLDRTSQAPAESLVDALTRVVTMNDDRLVMAQWLLLQDLAILSDETATGALIELASRDTMPVLLVEEARRALALRRNGVAAMLQALTQRYDFLAGALRGPPVGPLADALANLRESRAAPLLAEHLNDPADSLDDAKRAAAALAVLATGREAHALETFFASYRCIAVDDELVAAVGNAARALVRLDRRALIADALDDPFTSPPIKTLLAALLQTEPPPTTSRAAALRERP
jgi:outer membrane protein assembly factor BamB